MQLLETRQTQERKKIFSSIHIYTHTDTHIHIYTDTYLHIHRIQGWAISQEPQEPRSGLCSARSPFSLPRSPRGRRSPSLPDAQPALVLLPTAAHAFPVSWPPLSWAPADACAPAFLQDSLVFHPAALYPLTSSFVVLRMIGNYLICLLVYYLPVNSNVSFLRSLFTSKFLSSGHCHIRSINADGMKI